ncbi:hypothetical protein OE88DRAFT_633160 [Heliocybe sulcata]|uniref:Uncharacterized protein n=1 Tax=Heliocybe sulcata TaxID=5364 RepID=A0A5C3NHJ7_9AGAM|nr:hypothetical protein OE88DRAFT_633160 [Heliocybe sulcata]
MWQGREMKHRFIKHPATQELAGLSSDSQYERSPGEALRKSMSCIPEGDARIVNRGSTTLPNQRTSRSGLG